MANLNETVDEIWNGMPANAIPIIAARTTLRMLPNISFGKLSQNAAINLVPEFREALTQTLDLTGWTKFITVDERVDVVRSALKGIISVSDELSHQASYYAAKSAASAAEAADYRHQNSARAAVDASHFASSASSASRADEAAKISKEICQFFCDSTIVDLGVLEKNGKTGCLANRLLPEAEEYLRGFWQKIRESLSGSSPAFSFWREWYQGFLDGKPMDWELQRRVALIDDAIWEAGPEAVAGEIERIRAKYALEQEIAELKTRLVEVVTLTEAPQRGHNQPPEMIDDTKAIRHEITLVRRELEALETEIAKEEPSPSVIRKIAFRLWDISQKIIGYCASVGDVAIKAAAKTIGTAIGTAIVTETVAPGTLQSVVKIALDYASKLGG